MPPKIILASSSPYRLTLLRQINIEPIIIIPNIDERQLPNELPKDMALRLAFEKANKIKKQQKDNSIIIACDQILLLENHHIIGKPLTHENAVIQLKNMRNQSLVAYTALTMLYEEKNYSTYIETQIKMRNYTDELIEKYLHTEKPYNCAGSVKSEGLGTILIESMLSSDPTALIGLPLTKVTQGLILFNYPFIRLRKAFID